jgi:hypothetical protein
MDKQKTIDITGRLGSPSASGRANAQHARSEGTHYGKDRLGISTDLDGPAPVDTPPRPALQAYTPDMCPTDDQRRIVPTGEQVEKQSDLAAVPSGRSAPGSKRVVVLAVAGAVALAAAAGVWFWLGGSSATPQRAGATPARPAIPTTPVPPAAPKPPQAVRPAPPVVDPAPKPPAPAKADVNLLVPPPRPAARRAKAWLAPSRRPKAGDSLPKPPARPAPGEAPKPVEIETPKPPKPEAPPKAADEKKEKPAKKFRAPPAGIALGGIASFGDQRFADINGKFLTIGDTINGATLVTVGDMHVEMEIEGEYFQIEVGGASAPNGQEGE